MKTVALLLAVAGLAAVQATCPNMCSGHGSCTADDSCRCWMGYMGYDCSQRACPHVEGWAENNAESAHFYAECAGKGICDRSSGSCNCFDGYEGRGCERSSCPNGCSGNGVCRLISDLGNYVSGKSGWTAYSWDEKAISACVCDGGFMGPDCSEKYCPYGDDPMTVCEQGDVEQVQRVRFTLPGTYYASVMSNAVLENDEAALRFTASDGSVLYTGGFTGVFGQADGAGAVKGTTVNTVTAHANSGCWDGLASYTDVSGITADAGLTVADSTVNAIFSNDLSAIGGTGAAVTTTVVANVVTAVAVTTAGSGYSAGEVVVLPDDACFPVGVISAVDGAGAILGIHVASDGSAGCTTKVTTAIAARGTTTVTVASGAVTAVQKFLLPGEVFTATGGAKVYTVGDGNCDADTSVSSTSSSPTATGASNLETALESLPNIAIKDVTVSHTAGEIGYSSTVNSGNSLRNNFYVTFKHVDSGNSYGEQALLSCPNARTVGGSITTFGCGAAGCQPTILQPRAVSYSNRQKASSGWLNVATPVAKFTSQSVLTCPAGQTCTAAAAVHQGVIIIALVNNAADATYTGGLGVWVGSGGNAAPGAYTQNVGTDDAADYGTAPSVLVADSPVVGTAHTYGFKFYGNIADYAVDPSDATRKIVDISAVMADTKVSIVDPAASAGAMTAIEAALDSGADNTGNAALVEMAFTTAQCESSVDVTTTATEGAEVAFQNLDVENQECAGRGQCDRSSGQCDCFEGYHGLACSTQTILI